MLILWRGCPHLVAFLCLILCQPSAFAKPARPACWNEDFNSGTYEGWRVRAKTFIDYEICVVPQGRDGSPCLRIWASMKDPARASGGMSLRFYFAENGIEPIPVTDSTLIQWEWSIQECGHSGPVAVGPLLSSSPSYDARPFRTASNVSYPYPVLNDPCGAWCAHAFTHPDWILLGSKPESTVYVIGVVISLEVPQSQVLLVDNISVGRQGLVEPLPSLGGSGRWSAADYSAAIEDLDGDGRPDVFLPGANSVTRCRLKMSASDSTRGDEAHARGLASAAGSVTMFADFDNDGDQDLVAARARDVGPVIYENAGGAFFSGPSFCCESPDSMIDVACLACADVNNDGLLDVYLANPLGPDRLYLNKGDLRFARSDTSAAITLSVRFRSMGVTFSDVDGDGDQDLYVASAGVMLNDGTGHFRLQPMRWHGPELGLDERAYVEGGCFGDLDGDGRADLYLAVDREVDFAASPPANELFLNVGSGSFRLVSDPPGCLADTNHAEGVALADLDNDGDLDVFVGNRGGTSVYCRNLGGFDFERVVDSPFSALLPAGLAGIAVLDMNSDGALDLFQLLDKDGYRIIENPIHSRSFLKVRLLGTRSNWDGVGAKVFVYGDSSAEGEKPWQAQRELRASQGFQIAGPKELHFGLPSDGDFTVRVRFPSGVEVVRRRVHAGSTVRVVEANGLLGTAYWSSRRLWVPLAERIVGEMGKRTTIPLLVVFGLLVGVLCSQLGLGVRGLRTHRRFHPASVSVAVLVSLWGTVVLRCCRIHPGLVLGSFSASVVAGLYLPYLARSAGGRLTDAQVWERLNDELISYRHTEWSTNLASLLRLSGSLGSDLIDEEQKARLKELWGDAARQFLSATAKKLAVIADLARRMDETSRYGDEVRRLVKRARPAVAGADLEAVGALSRRIIAEIDALADVVDLHTSCVPRDCIDNAVSGVRKLLSRHQVRITEELLLGGRVRARILDHELVAILQDVIRNSVKAMMGRPRRDLGIVGRENSRNVSIEVLDTGIGLPSLEVEELFKAGLSTWDGSGFGLHYARKVLRRYHGEIEIHNRESESGARVVITLKRARDR